MSAPSQRLIGSQRLRDVALDALDHAGEQHDLMRSTLLLAELATLLSTYYRRVELVHRDDKGEVLVREEFNERVGAVELRTWWEAHATALVPEHQDAARDALCACGVSDGRPA